MNETKNENDLVPFHLSMFPLNTSFDVLERTLQTSNIDLYRLNNTEYTIGAEDDGLGNKKTFRVRRIFLPDLHKPTVLSHPR